MQATFMSDGPGGDLSRPPASVNATMPLLSVRDLHVRFVRDGRSIRAVDGVTLELHAGQALAIVGESGSGKTVTALSIMGLTPPAPGCMTSGSIQFDGEELIGATDARLRRLRGRRIAMVFQDPSTALNPLLPIGRQIVDALRAHGDVSRTDARREALEALELVQMPSASTRLDQYVHELSGGMRQRAAIALAVALRPDVLIADEPTTALDVAVQAHIMGLLSGLQRDLGMAVVLVTHDLGVVARYAESLAVMYAGRVVESGPTREVLGSPHAPYTAGLLNATPTAGRPRTRLVAIPGRPPDLSEPIRGCAFAPRCPLAMDRCQTDPPPLLNRGGTRAAACHVPAEEVRTRLGVVGAPGNADLSKESPGGDARDTTVLARFDAVELHYPVRSGLLRRITGHVHAVDGVTLAVHEGETLAVVGESGSGKTSLARTLMRLATPTAGRVTYLGIDVTRPTRTQRATLRREIQVVFQNPFGSLDPRMSVERILAEPLRAHGRSVDRGQAVSLLDSVGLSASALERYPREFSGGQLQRIAIARALVLDPRLLVCDEAVSALDVSIQAQVLNLLRDLQVERGLTYLFISHDLSVVRTVADRVAVMYLGNVVEEGDADAVLGTPRHPYTRALLSMAPADPKGPGPETAAPVLLGELPSPIDPPPGCRFATRCPIARPSCTASEPVLIGGQDHRAACFFPLDPGQMLPINPTSAAPIPTRRSR